MDFEEYYSKALPEQMKKHQDVLRDRMIEIVSKAISLILAKIQIQPPNWHRRVEFAGIKEICWEVAYVSSDWAPIYYYLLPDGRILKVTGGNNVQLISLNCIGEIDLAIIASGILKNAEINFGVSLNPAWKEPSYLRNRP